MTTQRLGEDSVNLTEIDGVPVAWSEGVGDPSAVLTFRVGQADETLLTRGYTHLAEHVALGDFTESTFPVNGTTGLSITQVFAATAPERLGHFVTTVASRLGRLASDLSDELAVEIRHDAKVLRAEQWSRGRSIVPELLADLYGVDSLGLTAQGELGLVELDLDAFSSWVRSRFSRQNAVLMLTTAPPPGMSLAALPDAAPHPAVAIGPTIAQTPGHRRRPGPFAVVGPIERSAAAAAMAGMYERALIRRLRHQAGSSYAPSVVYDPISAEGALITAVADSGHGHGTQVTDGALGELDRLASEGPTPDELAAHRDLVEYARASESRRRAHLADVSQALLFRSELRTEADVHDLMMGVDAEAVRDAASTWASATAVSIPADTVMTHEIPAFPEWSSGPPLDGPRVRTLPNPNRSKAAEVVLSTEGISLLEDDRKVTIRTEEVVALLQWDDGFEELVGRDGLSFRLVPNRWSDEDRVRQHLRRLAGDRALRMGLRFAAPPADPPARVPVRPSTLWIVSAFVVALAALGVFTDETSSPAWWIITALITLGIAFAYSAVIRMRLDCAQVYDEVEWHVNDQNWRPELPLARAYTPGAMKLAWLVDNGLLADWVEHGAAEHLDAYRAGDLDAPGLHRELGGVLASDMCAPEGRRFFNWLSSARVDRQILFDRWWREVWPRTGPYDLDLTPEILARSHAWFDKAARRYRFELPIEARRLADATRTRRPAGRPVAE